jgi:hypothetical protein
MVWMVVQDVTLLVLSFTLYAWEKRFVRGYTYVWCAHAV